MNKTNIIDNCLIAIEKAKSFRNLNIFTTETFDFALKQAKKSNSRLINRGISFLALFFGTFFKWILLNLDKVSDIDGSLFTIKDNFCTKTLSTSCGSLALKNFIPRFNATVVERLYNAGAILIGKTNLDEFGMGAVTNSIFGTTKNPQPYLFKNSSEKNLDDFFISGGSSGGSAASIAAGLADLYLKYNNLSKNNQIKILIKLQVQ